MSSLMFDWSKIAQDISNNYISKSIIIIYGQTATGKTTLSLELAKKLKKPVEIISSDSRQVYRYMDIGTDKVDISIREKIIHHQIDIIDPNQIYTAWQWQQDTYMLIEQILARGNIPIIVGGTGLYIDTIVYNFSMNTTQPDYHYRERLEEIEKKKPGTVRKMLNKIDPKEASKNHPHSIRFIIRALEICHVSGKTKTELMQKGSPRYPLLMVGLEQDVGLGNELIDARIDFMIQNGLIQEVERLLQMGYDPDSTGLKTIDYRQTISYLRGELNYSEYIQTLQTINHQLAKKQRTRFRRYKKDIQKGSDTDNHDPYIKYLNYYLPDYFLV